jgi:hypothetical protein
VKLQGWRCWQGCCRRRIDGGGVRHDCLRAPGPHSSGGNGTRAVEGGQQESAGCVGVSVLQQCRPRSAPPERCKGAAFSCAGPATSRGGRGATHVVVHHATGVPVVEQHLHPGRRPAPAGQHRSRTSCHAPGGNRAAAHSHHQQTLSRTPSACGLEPHAGASSHNTRGTRVTSERRQVHVPSACRASSSQLTAHSSQLTAHRAQSLSCCLSSSGEFMATRHWSNVWEILLPHCCW